MIHSFEYIIIYATPAGKRAGIFKSMRKKELDAILQKLQADGCSVEKVKIIRRAQPHCP
ncbi:MAG TPA: hypothetical protein GX699_12055 [Firmicutes bacterium]|nr:hypothetical protein [Bacillota bacterium]